MFIEQEIEARLKIVDAAVDGEYAGNSAADD